MQQTILPPLIALLQIWRPLNQDSFNHCFIKVLFSLLFHFQSPFLSLNLKKKSKNPQKLCFSGMINYWPYSKQNSGEFKKYCVVICHLSGVHLPFERLVLFPLFFKDFLFLVPSSPKREQKSYLGLEIQGKWAKSAKCMNFAFLSIFKQMLKKGFQIQIVLVNVLLQSLPLHYLPIVF